MYGFESINTAALATIMPNHTEEMIRDRRILVCRAGSSLSNLSAIFHHWVSVPYWNGSEPMIVERDAAVLQAYPSSIGGVRCVSADVGFHRRNWHFLCILTELEVACITVGTYQWWISGCTQVEDIATVWSPHSVHIQQIWTMAFSLGCRSVPEEVFFSSYQHTTTRNGGHFGRHICRRVQGITTGMAWLFTGNTLMHLLLGQHGKHTVFHSSE